jgi:hypothetical protein
MKISITPPVPAGQFVTPVFLCGEDETEMPAGLRLNGKRVLQVSEKYRKVDVAVFDRKNLRNTFTFQVKRRPFASLALAESFILLHEATLPNAGLITFYVGEGSEFYMRGGIDSVDLVEQMGVSTVWSYTLIGGRIFGNL